MKNKNITRNGILAALYIVITVTLGALSYGPLQFRISMMLVPIAFMNKKLAPGIIIGVALSNLISPVGLIDVLIGAFINTVSQLFNYAFKKPYLSALFQSIVIAVCVGIELQYFMNVPFQVSSIPLFVSNFILLMSSTFILYRLKNKNAYVYKKITLQD